MQLQVAAITIPAQVTTIRDLSLPFFQRRCSHPSPSQPLQKEANNNAV